MVVAAVAAMTVIATQVEAVPGKVAVIQASFQYNTGHRRRNVPSPMALLSLERMN